MGDGLFEAREVTLPFGFAHGLKGQYLSTEEPAEFFDTGVLFGFTVASTAAASRGHNQSGRNAVATHILGRGGDMIKVLLGVTKEECAVAVVGDFNA